MKRCSVNLLEFILKEQWGLFVNRICCGIVDVPHIIFSDRVEEDGLIFS